MNAVYTLEITQQCRSLKPFQEYYPAKHNHSCYADSFPFILCLIQICLYSVKRMRRNWVILWAICQNNLGKYQPKENVFINSSTTQALKWRTRYMLTCSHSHNCFFLKKVNNIIPGGGIFPILNMDTGQCLFAEFIVVWCGVLMRYISFKQTPPKVSVTWMNVSMVSWELH